MGYYTDYSLEVKNLKNREEFDSLVESLKETGMIGYALDEGTYYDSEQYAYFSCWEGAKWYEHDNDMRRISKEFPDAVFMLDGNGEEFEDLWRTYYKNGDWEICHGQITYPDPINIKW